MGVIIYVIIWCYHLLLSFLPFFLFPENVTHSKKLSMFTTPIVQITIWRTNQNYTLLKKKMKFSSYIRNFWNKAVAKSYMREGFLIYVEIRKYLTIYEEATTYIWPCNCSIPSFLIYEENFIFFFISVGSLSPLLRCRDLRFSCLGKTAKEAPSLEGWKVQGPKSEVAEGRNETWGGSFSQKIESANPALLC